MTRDRPTDTQPAFVVDPTGPGTRPLDETDPGGAPALIREDRAPPLTTEAEMLKAEQLIDAFKRPPVRPTPAYTERAESDGGNAVGYGTTARAAPGLRPIEEREKVLVQLAEVARAVPHAPPTHRPWLIAPSRTGVPTGPSKEKRRRRRYLGIGILAALVVSSVLIRVALHIQPGVPAVEGAPSAVPAIAALPTAVLGETRPLPEKTAPRGEASPAIREVPLPTARPAWPSGTTSDRHRVRPPEPRLEPSAAPAATTPLKERFWE